MIKVYKIENVMVITFVVLLNFFANVKKIERVKIENNIESI
ncbi:MAG TPA: hypothetical protein PLI27_01590 [Ignavibacteriales bacterium]|nr:hypothetical protein [Ignavibacteriales bacterium]HOL80974.1 hypothetical protein [Ignavibacteriales bacterium]HOM64709.1 hypothetical protein [Ignavibacteriales bacterium]HPD66759.1 hypothetical protein [Ignavibacteriales bacterium]HPP32754.1 hypothetical protein [Ignavibacteriales bacterium]